MGFWDDFAEGFTMPFKYVYSKFEKIDKLADGLANAGVNVANAGANAAGGLADILAGNSNILLYLGIGIVAITVLPVLIEKLL